MGEWGRKASVFWWDMSSGDVAHPSLNEQNRTLTTPPLARSITTLVCRVRATIDTYRHAALLLGVAAQRPLLPNAPPPLSVGGRGTSCSRHVVLRHAGPRCHPRVGGRGFNCGAYSDRVGQCLQSGRFFLPQISSRGAGGWVASFS